MIHGRNVIRNILNIAGLDAGGFIVFRTSAGQLKEDCVPSICDEKTASFRTYV